MCWRSVSPDFGRPFKKKKSETKKREIKKPSSAGEEEEEREGRGDLFPTYFACLNDQSFAIQFGEREYKGSESWGVG